MKNKNNKIKKVIIFWSIFLSLMIASLITLLFVININKKPDEDTNSNQVKHEISLLAPQPETINIIVDDLTEEQKKMIQDTINQLMPVGEQIIQTQTEKIQGIVKAGNKPIEVPPVVLPPIPPRPTGGITDVPPSQPRPTGGITDVPPSQPRPTGGITDVPPGGNNHIPGSPAPNPPEGGCIITVPAPKPPEDKKPNSGGGCLIEDKKPNEETIPLFTAKPYNTYINKQGDTIREYSIFTTLKPTVKDYHGRINFFETKQISKVFPTKHYIAVYDYFAFAENIDLKDFKTGKTVGGWPDASKNYQFVRTNQPKLHPIILKYDIGSEYRENVYDKVTSVLTTEEREAVQPYLSQINNLKNKSICFLDSSDKISKDVYLVQLDQYPYFRFRTKNLELKLTDAAIQYNQEQINKNK